MKLRDHIKLIPRNNWDYGFKVLFGALAGVCNNATQAPISCNDIPENKIVMQDNVLYFHSGDAIDLANQIQWALGHPGEMSSLGRKASICMKDNLSWGKIVKQYEEIYRACIKGN